MITLKSNSRNRQYQRHTVQLCRSLALRENTGRLTDSGASCNTRRTKECACLRSVNPNSPIDIQLQTVKTRFFHMQHKVYVFVVTCNTPTPRLCKYFMATRFNLSTVFLELCLCQCVNFLNFAGTLSSIKSLSEILLTNSH